MFLRNLKMKYYLMMEHDLMVEHNLSVVSKLCDRITVLAQGAVLTEGDYQTVSADPRVREVYMGSDGSGERGSQAAASENVEASRSSIWGRATVSELRAAPKSR